MREAKRLEYFFLLMEGNVPKCNGSYIAVVEGTAFVRKDVTKEEQGI